MNQYSESTFRIHALSNAKLSFALRLLLGLTLLVFGASKLPDLNSFVETVISYRILPVPLAQAYGFALPWAELILGTCLVLGVGLRFVAPTAILVIATFIIGTSASLYWLGAGIKRCGCLGGVDWPLGASHLIAQVFMLTMAAQIMLHKGEFLSLDGKLFRK